MSKLHSQTARVRLAELSQRAGVPRSTIKFYIREGLLAPGAVHARNQASYGSAHLERLALIRALREVAGLPLEAVARVAHELDRGWKGDPYREAMRALHAPSAQAERAEDAGALRQLRGEVRAFLRTLPWSGEDERHLFADEIADALLLVRRHLYPEFAVADLRPYADAAWLLSEAEFELAPGGARVPSEARGDELAEPIRRAILGTVLFERIFAALRRSANATRSVRLSTGARIPPARPPRVRRRRRR
ncbi:MAG TPA: MerR family transcriptional regulator [Myxococcota bacterium]|nr:MerR family transcriptional regulator [Myxococcota bacterium]